MIALIDYKAGNVASVLNALHRIGAEAVVTDQISVLDQADSIIFPGVGHAKPAMDKLREKELDSWLRQTRKPVLGICLGMQLLFSSTEEGNTECLDIIPGRLYRFDSNSVKTPHMGWNELRTVQADPLLHGLPPAPFYYFVHSYYAPVTPETTSVCDYDLSFAATVRKGNFCGVQFHPEKSGEAGRILLRNFVMGI